MAYVVVCAVFIACGGLLVGYLCVLLVLGWILNFVGVNFWLLVIVGGTCF